MRLRIKDSKVVGVCCGPNTDGGTGLGLGPRGLFGLWDSEPTVKGEAE